MRTTGVADLVLDDGGRPGRWLRRRRRARRPRRPRWRAPPCGPSGRTACPGRCSRWRRGDRRWPGRRRRASAATRGRRPSSTTTAPVTLRRLWLGDRRRGPRSAARGVGPGEHRRDPGPQPPRRSCRRRRGGEGRRRHRVPEHRVRRAAARRRRRPRGHRRRSSTTTSSPTSSTARGAASTVSAPSCADARRPALAACRCCRPRHAGRQIILTSGTTGRPKGAQRSASAAASLG